MNKSPLADYLNVINENDAYSIIRDFTGKCERYLGYISGNGHHVYEFYIYQDKIAILGCLTDNEWERCGAELAIDQTIFNTLAMNIKIPRQHFRSLISTMLSIRVGGNFEYSTIKVDASMSDYENFSAYLKDKRISLVF